MIKNKYSKFVGSLIKDGKKIIAKKILDQTFYEISDTLNIPMSLIQKKLDKKLKVYMEVKVVKRGKRVNVIPVPINKNRQNFLIRKWIIASAKENLQKICFKDKLKAEIMQTIINKKSPTIEKRLKLNNLVRNNRSNAHYRW